MEITDDIARFLVRPLHAVLATHAPNRTISQSVVWYKAEDTFLWISCRPEAVKARHVAEDPLVSLLVLAPHGGAYVRVEGHAVIDGTVSDADRLDLVSPYLGADAEIWLGEHPLPSPNAKLRIVPDRIVSQGV